MGRFTLQSTMSISVKDNKSDALSRVRQLNQAMNELCERFSDLSLMMFEFGEEDFHDDIVYTTESRMVPLPKGSLSIGHITIHAGQRIFRDYAEKHGVPYRETPPPGHPDHPHSGTRPGT